ncbi:Serine/threonine-protein kinase PrkC [Enhygromyxa salina]|uniref:Serine/threonine-protein kinase PrkC n=1 Tax=Enhygromyxa salina TaxID=215803 RepID=A0A2S9XEH5_9BACT|nr:serine/threonine-protein kinase [Enhygromyxa salina]PRP91081.1 Serine/threonine-protein kinase PrkC [Enhygromyxa salina]
MSRDPEESSDRRRVPSARWHELIEAVTASPGIELGRFKLLAWIGGGGMGVVFRAHDTELDREVALKLWKLPPGEAKEAVVHEAKCLAKLSHPNVVAVYGTGEVDDDVFLVMELVDGMDGRLWISSFQPSWRQIVDLYVLAGHGLAAAHAAGLEHGDFKPENVLLGRDHRVHVADFGVARALREHICVDDDPLAAEGNAGLGTLAYMAPERLHGRRGDARSDQFSFCVTVWECLYGKRPFDGPTELAMLEAMERGGLQTNPAATAYGIPRRLRQAITRGLAMDPAERWPDMASLLAALDEIRRRPDERKRWRWIAVSAVGLMLGSSAVTAWLVTSRTQAHTESGINSELKTTLLHAEQSPASADEAELLADELISLIEAGKLDEAQRRWVEVEDSATQKDKTIEHEALVITRALISRAQLLARKEPTTSTALAFHAFAPLSYSTSRYPLDHPAQTELDSLRDVSMRLTSRATRLVGRYTESLRAELGHTCSCDPPMNADDCDAIDSDSVALHACLTELLVNHEDELAGYLSCLAPATESHTTCVMAVTDCNVAGIESCDATRARAEGECSPLTPSLRRAFAACAR